MRQDPHGDPITAGLEVLVNGVIPTRLPRWTATNPRPERLASLRPPPPRSYIIQSGSSTVVNAFHQLLP